MPVPQQSTCPVCGALPGSPCTRLEGGVMPYPHSKRDGAFPRNERGRVAVRKVRRPAKSADSKLESPQQN